MPEKTCSMCKTGKNIDEFPWRNKSKGYKMSCCKVCNAQRAKKYRNTTPTPDKKYRNTTPTPDKKMCSKCDIVKEIGEFYYDSTRKSYQTCCKDCVKLRRSTNRPKINAWKKKYRLNPEIRIREAVQSRLSSFISVGSNSGTLQHYTGCPREYLLNWIKHQLYGHLDMFNYGIAWHIDHCTPCSSYDLHIESELLSCFNWRNLRPLTKESNLKKGVDILPRDIMLQELKATVYEKHFPLPDVVKTTEP